MGVGDGREPVFPAIGEDAIRIPDHMAAPTEDIDDLIDTIYGSNLEDLSSTAFLVGRAILTPKNVDVDAINKKGTARFPGQVLPYLPASQALSWHAAPGWA